MPSSTFDFSSKSAYTQHLEETNPAQAHWFKKLTGQTSDGIVMGYTSEYSQRIYHDSIPSNDELLAGYPGGHDGPEQILEDFTQQELYDLLDHYWPDYMAWLLRDMKISPVAVQKKWGTSAEELEDMWAYDFKSLIADFQLGPEDVQALGYTYQSDDLRTITEEQFLAAGWEAHDVVAYMRHGDVMGIDSETTWAEMQLTDKERQVLEKAGFVDPAALILQQNIYNGLIGAAIVCVVVGLVFFAGRTFWKGQKADLERRKAAEEERLQTEALEKAARLTAEAAAAAAAGPNSQGEMSPSML